MTAANTTDITTAGADITNIANEINAAHARAENSLRASVELALRVGELLLQAKRTVGHGKWATWLEENIKFSDRLAQAYMRLARLPVEKRNALRDLPLREALSAIRSREKLLADAEERANRPPTGAARICTVVDGKVLFGKEAIAARASGRPPQPASEATPEEIADDLVSQLEEAASTAPATLTADHLRDAFERRFGAQTAMSSRNDIGPDSSSEADRLRARVEELEAENARLKRENIALRSEVDELKAPSGSARRARPQSTLAATSDGAVAPAVTSAPTVTTAPVSATTTRTACASSPDPRADPGEFPEWLKRPAPTNH
jgi:hypothetical protein